MALGALANQSIHHLISQLGSLTRAYLHPRCQIIKYPIPFGLNAEPRPAANGGLRVVVTEDGRGGEKARAAITKESRAFFLHASAPLPLAHAPARLPLRRF